MKEKAIICDLDSTLFNTDHRIHHIKGQGKPDWDAFNAACVDNTPNKWCVELVLAMRRAGHDIIFVTGRWDDYYADTARSIADHLGPLDCLLFMRKKGDFRKDFDVKREIYQEHIAENYDVSFCVEDRGQVVDMWRSLGLVCLDCVGGEY